MGVCVNLLLLAYFKYADFFVSNLTTVLGWNYEKLEIILPMGISFYTFTQIAFLVDAYRREAHEYKPINYGLFVTYFPHLIAGPILHHKEMMPQFSKVGGRIGVNADCLCLGFGFLAIGLFKKLVIADSLAVIADAVFDAVGSPTLIEAWIAALAYTFQLYFDFSGYSDMAIGISLMFGIWLPLNFNSPYQAMSIVDFWRRWHMTLSRFLKEYVYIPLGGNRNGRVARSRNLIITMLIGGVWHGAGWTFVIWGALHGLFLLINHVWRNVSRKVAFPFLRSSGVHIFGGTLTFICVVVGWVFFRSSDVGTAVKIIKGMLGYNGFALPAQVTSRLDLIPITSLITESTRFAYPDLIGVSGTILLVSLLVFCTPNSQQLLLGINVGTTLPLEVSERSSFLRIPARLRALLTACVALIAIGHISELSPFLYFQF